MSKCASEIYANIVAAPIGELVSTRHKNGIYYNQTIEDMLSQQGYKENVDFETVFVWSTSITYIKKIAPIRPYEEPKHNIKVGDIFTYSWGYDQTNIDFYQVVSTSAKTIAIRKIKAGQTDYDAHYMSGHKVPLKDEFCKDEVLRKTPRFISNKWWIPFEYGVGQLWDGKPEAFTCYA